MYLCVCSVWRSARRRRRCSCTRALRDKTVAEVSPERDTVRAPRYVSAAASSRAIRMRARSRRSAPAGPAIVPDHSAAHRAQPPSPPPDRGATTTRHRTLPGWGGGGRGASGPRWLRPLSRATIVRHTGPPSLLATTSRRPPLFFVSNILLHIICIERATSVYWNLCIRTLSSI